MSLAYALIAYAVLSTLCLIGTCLFLRAANHPSHQSPKATLSKARGEVRDIHHSIGDKDATA